MSNKCQPHVLLSQPSPPERPDANISTLDKAGAYASQNNAKSDFETGTPQNHHDNTPLSEAEAYNRALYHSGALGQLLLIILIAFLSLLMFAFALEGITSQFNMIAASSFDMHSEIGAINTASELINGISKPLMGKLADLTSRPIAYIITLVFYGVGYTVAASCTNIASYVVGVALTSVGKAGLHLLCLIIIGDLTTLQWRGLWDSLAVSPYLITVFINGFISNGFVPDKWRWGLGMFAIMMPALLAPTVLILFDVQHRGRIMEKSARSDVASKARMSVSSYVYKIGQGLIAIDLPGLILMGFSFSLILLPLSLAENAEGGWNNPSMIAIEVVGWAILAIFILFEIFIAPKPIMAKRIIKNKVFLLALSANLFDQMTTAIGSNYFPSYIYIIKDWSNYSWTVFTSVRTLSLCTFSILYGMVQARFHRYKSLMVIGSIIKVVGYSACLTSENRSSTSTATLAIAQILMGISAFTDVGSRVGAQASVPHEDMASVLASYFLWSYIGRAAGNSIASAVWTSKMLKYMREECPPGTSEKVLRDIYGSIKVLRTDYSPGSPIREGAIRAYRRTNGIIFIIATCISVMPVLCSLFMPGKQSLPS